MAPSFVSTGRDREADVSGPGAVSSAGSTGSAGLRNTASARAFASLLGRLVIGLSVCQFHIVFQHEEPDRRGQIGRKAALIDASEQFCKIETFRVCNLPQRCPERTFDMD